jgi:hypothetical protein
MRIGRALSEKKAAQNKLARLLQVRNQVFVHEKGKKPDMRIAELDREIEATTKMIRGLKLRIIYTNCNTRLENEMTLQEAIVTLGDLRSELSAYNALLGLETEPQDDIYGLRRRPVRDRVAQLTKKDLLAKIERLEGRKYELDALIAKANNTVDLVERLPGAERP